MYVYTINGGGSITQHDIPHTREGFFTPRPDIPLSKLEWIVDDGDFARCSAGTSLRQLIGVYMRGPDGIRRRYLYQRWYVTTHIEGIVSELQAYANLQGLDCLAEIIGWVCFDDDNGNIYQPPTFAGLLWKDYPLGPLSYHIKEASVKRKEKWILQMLDIVDKLEQGQHTHRRLELQSFWVDVPETEVEWFDYIDGGANERLKVVDLAGTVTSGKETHYDPEDRWNEIFALGKTFLEIMIGDTLGRPSGASEDHRGYVSNTIKEEYPGFIGEVIWMCCGGGDKPRAKDIKRVIKEKFGITSGEEP
ncbi:hypothetical protein ABW19_dt0210401 [Dactylella cylindrospora]|nr:hypothetical protein ABW19_dt0210401 [Dactylella cylindrospora]